AFQFILLTSSGLLRKEKYSVGGHRGALLLALLPVCFIANSMLFYFAFRNTSIGNAVLTHYTAPVFVALLAPLLLKEKISKTTWTAIILSSAGLWLVLGGQASGPQTVLAGNEHLGIIAGALSGLAYAFLIIIIRRIATLYSSLFITFIQNGIVALVLLPFAFAVPVSMETLTYLIIMGIVHSTAAPLLYVQGFRSVKANEAAVLGYFEPVAAIILAFIVLHEVPGVTSLFGGAMIIFSGYLILKARTA
ncbi:MAG: EamA family transporter, partial [Nitrospirae bacterium]|nr:EamA family transporter [Nitrospirota bacterium]